MKLYSYLRRRYWNWRFNRMDRKNQNIARILGVDPDSLRRRGLL